MNHSAPPRWYGRQISEFFPSSASQSDLCCPARLGLPAQGYTWFVSCRHLTSQFAVHLGFWGALESTISYLLLRSAELNLFSVYISRRKTLLCAKNAISFTYSMICVKLQKCAATHRTEITTKNKVWLISTFTGWLESEELCMFSISSRSESESYDTEACYTLLSGNGIIALLVDPKWSPLHPPVFVCIMMSAPWTHNSDLSDFRVNTNCF